MNMDAFLEEKTLYICTLCEVEFNDKEDFGLHECKGLTEHKKLQLLEDKYFSPNVDLHNNVRFIENRVHCVRCSKLLFNREKFYITTDPYGNSSEWEWKIKTNLDRFYAFNMCFCEMCYNEFKIRVLKGLEVLDGTQEC